MGVVVVLMTLLVVLLSGLTAGLGRESTSAIADLSADHLAFSAPAAGEQVSFADSSVDESQSRRWARVPGVERAEPVGIGTTEAVVGTATAAVSAFGVDPGSGLVPGRDDVAAGEVVLSTGAAEALGAGPGDRVDAAGRTMSVAAVSGSDSFNHTPVMWTSLDDWRQLTRSDPGAATVIALTEDGADLAHADAQLGTATVGREAAFEAIGSYPSENGSLQLMRLMLFGISALVVGAFFTVWTIQRTGDIAVLKALGASSAYLVGDALAQALVVLVGGTVLGAAAAAGIGALASGSVPFVLSTGSVVVPAVVMVLLGGLGAALSVRRVTSVDPLIALGSAR